MNRLDYSLGLILRGIDLLQQFKSMDFTKHNIARSLLCYHLREHEGKWLPLNRDYKPIGLCTREYVDYKGYDFLLIDKDKTNIENIEDRHRYENGVYFWSDNCSPRTAEQKHRYINLVHSVFNLNIKNGE